MKEVKEVFMVIIKIFIVAWVVLCRFFILISAITSFLYIVEIKGIAMGIIPKIIVHSSVIYALLWALKPMLKYLPGGSY